MLVNVMTTCLVNMRSIRVYITSRATRKYSRCMAWWILRSPGASLNENYAKLPDIDMYAEKSMMYLDNYP